jgi:predicted Zn finger-like uncharacterized protein
MEKLDNVILVRCPECDTVSNFAKHKVGINPKRVKCPECGETLNLARRSSIPPEGLRNFEYVPLYPDMEENVSDFGILRESYSNLSSEDIPSTQPPAHRPDREGVPLKTFRQYFDENDPTWQEKKPDKLLSCTIGQITTLTRRAGKVAIAVVLLSVMLLVYVAYRNNWTLSSEGFPDQLDMALTGERPVKLPPAARKIEVTVDDRQTMLTKDGQMLVVVHGEVYNDGLTSQKGIMLRGRLVDPYGKVYAETVAPCGKLESYDAIMSTEKDVISERYRERSEYYNCQIKPNAIGRYQLIFDVVPNPTIPTDVDVRVVSTQYP